MQPGTPPKQGQQKANTFSYRHKDKAYQLTGVNPDTVLPMYHPRSTTMTCWAACLSNAISTAKKAPTVAEQAIIERFHMDGWEHGPRTGEYQEMINIAMQELAGMSCKCTVVGNLGQQDMVPFRQHLKAVQEGQQVIVGVLDNSHVINLLAFGTSTETGSRVVAVYDPDPAIGFQIGSFAQYLTGYKPTDAFVLPVEESRSGDASGSAAASGSADASGSAAAVAASPPQV